MHLIDQDSSFSGQPLAAAAIVIGILAVVVAGVFLESKRSEWLNQPFACELKLSNKHKSCR